MIQRMFSTPYLRVLSVFASASLIAFSVIKSIHNSPQEMEQSLQTNLGLLVSLSMVPMISNSLKQQGISSVPMFVFACKINHSC